MDAIRRLLQPRLAGLGALLADDVSLLAGAPMTVHVAKHLRRRVNPPDDTWVAWGPSPRGYKAYPHFEAGISGTGVFARFVLKPEAQAFKGGLLDALGPKALAALEHARRRPVYWYQGDHGEDPVPVTELTDAVWLDRRAWAARPHHSVAVGAMLPRARAEREAGQTAAWILRAFRDVAPLYALATEGRVPGAVRRA